MNNKKSIGCGCFTFIILIVFLLVIMFSCSGGGDSNQEEEQKDTQVQETKVDQTITFGDYQATFDNFSIADGDLTAHITVTNNSVSGRAIDDIIGTTVMQAGTQLSKSSNNLYNNSNETALQEYLDPGRSKTIELKYKMASDDNMFEFDMFNDSSLGLSDQGLGSDLTVNINPVDSTFTTDIYNEPNHG